MLDFKSFSCIQSFVFSIDAPYLTLRNTYRSPGSLGGRKQKGEKGKKISKAEAVTDTTS